MGITNYRIDKINGEVKKRETENVDVKESFSIGEVTKKNAQMVEVQWSFNTDYKAIGKLSLEGVLTYFSDSLTEKVVEKEAKGKKGLVLKGDALRDVSNFVLRRGIIESIILSKTLMLPAPIQLPSVKVKSEK